MDKHKQGLSLYESNRKRGFISQKLGALKTNRKKQLRADAKQALGVLFANDDKILDILLELGVPFLLLVKYVEHPRRLFEIYFETVIEYDVDRGDWEIMFRHKMRAS